MIHFFEKNDTIFAVNLTSPLATHDIDKLIWLFGNAHPINSATVAGSFIGPRKEMITPWSTNAVEITQNMGIGGIIRIEEFKKATAAAYFDPMLQVKYEDLDQEIFHIAHAPEPIKFIDEIAAYNMEEGLALSDEEVQYLNEVADKLGRKLTDSEVFGFSQVNSEHCRHKIFNGQFIVDGISKDKSLFQLIKETSKKNPNTIVSAYKDNVAFVKGPRIQQFAPATQDKADFFEETEFDSVISLKAETHNFPTTVEPFNGAATGSGGEIRDRLAGGKGSLPLAGTAVYMTSYPRLSDDRPWVKGVKSRDWLYQSPLDILIKASDGASDFGNKFGQPLISGSLLTFEHEENSKIFGYDKVIMQAGGIGYGKLKDSIKEKPETGDRIVILGGDNYRIGMGGSAVSSVATGEFKNSIELNAIQRSNPEMQKRVMNAIRALQESNDNPIVSIHDHGAGGHLNCLSELVEETGGSIDIAKLPKGDPTLSDKEMVGNESQERMGLILKEKDLARLATIAARERAPMYNVGKATGDQHFEFKNSETNKSAVDWELSHMFGSSPKTVLSDQTALSVFKAPAYSNEELTEYIKNVLKLEAVACKDWLTNKVDRSVTGKVVSQQTAGPIQLPINDVAVMALDYGGFKGVATSIGHAPVSALINPAAGSKLAIAEALTNLIWAPLTHGLGGVSLSANWMWPAKNEGEDARLYEAVEAVSQFAIDLGINIPTGKDSLSMTQKYPDGKTVYSPGTVIISTVAEVADIRSVVSADLKNVAGSKLIYINMGSGDYHLGGSAFVQTLNIIGKQAPAVGSTDRFISAFTAIQQLIHQGLILAGHDISAGGIITTLLEMCFPQNQYGLNIDLSTISFQDIVSFLFSESPGVVIQVSATEEVEQILNKSHIDWHPIGDLSADYNLTLRHQESRYSYAIDEMRNAWFSTSHLFDREQTGELADERAMNFGKQPLEYNFPKTFDGKLESILPKEKGQINAAIIREKGVNGDREMAWIMHLAGFNVKDVHMTDLISGREDLSDIQFIVFVGGFSNSDVLGSAKGWAGAFLYNEKAKAALNNFYSRPDTLSLGVCNGCQLMMELGLLFPEMKAHPKMHHNASQKFESGFVNMRITESNAVMMQSLADTQLGVWLAHGEGRFVLPGDSADYNIVGYYANQAYPANPNGSDFSTAAVCSNDGRHLAMMPHLERSLYPHNWPYYNLRDKKIHEATPWLLPFVDAYKWFSKG